MNYYIGTKLIKAEPMNLGDYNIFKGWQIPADENPLRDGYKVQYSDDYISWSPKEEFEKAYMVLSTNKALKTDAPSISQKMVDSFIRETNVSTLGDRCTVVRATLINGFEIVESSACVSVENYDEKMGAEICMEKIKDKVWMLLGFLLQTAVNGIKED